MKNFIQDSRSYISNGAIATSVVIAAVADVVADIIAQNGFKNNLWNGLSQIGMVDYYVVTSL
jgi:hypothetical protein